MNRITTASRIILFLRRKIGRAWLIFCCLACLVSSTRAANRTWTSAISGVFGAAGSWTGGVPGAADSATFVQAGTYTVTFDNTSIPVLPNPESNQDLFFQDGKVTFNSGSGGPYTYQLTGAGGDDAIITGNSLTLGTSGNPLHLMVDDALQIRGGANMTANFGSHITTTNLILGNSTAPAGNGTLVIDGTGSLLRVGTSAQIGAGGMTGTLTVRNNATADFNGTINLADGSISPLNTGILNVQSGGAITTASIRIGSSATNGQVGMLTVGSVVGTSTVTQDTNTSLIVGANLAGPTPNVATLNVDPHGVFNSGSGTGTITVNATGTINLIGTLNANGNVTVNGGLLHENNFAAFALAAGKTLLITNGGRSSFSSSGYVTATNANYNVAGAGSKLESTGAVSVQNNAAVNVSAGGLASSANRIDIGTNGNGTLSVDGSGSSAISTGAGASSWGGNGGNAFVMFTGDASGTFNNGINLNSGIVQVDSGADLSVGQLTISSFDGTAALFVEGGGSTVTQTGASALFVGDPSSNATGTSTILIGEFISGATFTTGTGVSTINKSGRVTIGSTFTTGSFFANGNVTIDGGVLEQKSGSLFQLAAGKTMTIQNGGLFSVSIYETDNAIYNVSGVNSKLESSIGGVLRIYHGGRVNVSSGGLVSSSLSLPIGLDGNGRLSIDGIGSTALANGTGTSFWGQSGNTATVTFTNNALGTFNGGIEMANSTAAGTTAVVNILSGADLNVAGKLLLAGLNGASSATLNVQGAGSTVTQTGANVLTVGHASAGTAIVSVLDGGAITSGTGIITIAQTGTLLLDGTNARGTFSANGAMTVLGSVQVGQLPGVAGGMLNVNAGLTIDGGTVHLIGGVINANSISPTNGGVFDVAGGTLHVDQFNGNLVNVGGTLAPGHSAGNTTIVGNYSQQTGAALEIEIGGLSAGSNYDLVGVTGTALLGGELQLALIGSFVPTAANTFTVLNAGGIVGVFSNVTTGQRLTTLDGNGSFRVNYGAGSAFNNNQIVLDAFQVVALPGDYNGNNVVDAADYVVWRKGLGTTFTQNDYDVWRSHFGQTAGSGSSAIAFADGAVPEPGVWILALVCPAATASLRRRRSRKIVVCAETSTME